MLRPFPATRRAKPATSARLRPLLGRRTGDLLHQHRHTYAAPPRRIRTVLHRDVVAGHHAGHLDAGLGGGEFGGHLEVQHVAGVVLHDVQHAGTAVDGRGGRLNLIGDR